MTETNLQIGQVINFPHPTRDGIKLKIVKIIGECYKVRVLSGKFVSPYIHKKYLKKNYIKLYKKNMESSKDKDGCVTPRDKIINIYINACVTIQKYIRGYLCRKSKKTPISCVLECINFQKKKEESKDVWEGSAFYDITKLESNNVGEVGETLLEQFCKNLNIKSSIDGTKTKQKGGGIGDGMIKNKTNEIKTARLGNGGSKSFQHELGEYPWKAEYMTFIDFHPKYVYLTIFKNWSEEFYKNSGIDKSKKCIPYFPTKTITQRKGGFNFKLDTSIAINEINVKNKYTLKITADTTYTDIKEYINRTIT
tara:strand:+ start:896 stop:1822 length:927 start_codon:yes stop_codon:yes gene_type:complete